MKTSLAITHVGRAGIDAVRTKADLYPYFDYEMPKNETLHHLISGAQQVVRQQRRADFDSRLVELRSRGESLRSFPTDTRSSTWHIDGRPDIQALLSIGGPLSHHVENCQRPDDAGDLSEVEAGGDPYPFGSPPMDASAYSDIEVEAEYDMGTEMHPAGEEGQPDVLDWTDATVGSITKIGFFPYRYKKNENKTHMIRIGTKDHWGVDLERVVREFSLREGDHIALMSIGKQPVVVKTRVRQEDGTYKLEEKDAMRNTWVCKRV